VILRTAPAVAEPRTPAEAALDALFVRLSVLERELAELSSSLRLFREQWRERVGPAENELFAAKRLEERIARLSLEAEQWRTAPPSRPARPDGRRRKRPLAPWLPARAPSQPATPWMELKELYRSVVRRLHPDFARSDAERARSSELLARVNAAYERGDRVLIELVHVRVVTEDDPAEATPENRESHAAERLATLEPLATSLEKELATLRAMREKARLSLTRALATAASLAEVVRTTRVRPRSLPEPEPGRLLRPAVARLERTRAGRDAKAFAQDLERKAAKEPWVAALAFFALFAEMCPDSPGTASLSAVSERYDAVKMAWPESPAFESVLLALPSFLEIGLRAHPDRLGFGLQLKRRELLSGVRDCMGSPKMAPIARRVFESLGRSMQCGQCGKRGFELHVLRLRAPGEVHALVCPLCAAVVESYKTLGRPEGLEALSSFARQLEAVVELRLRVADLTLIFELLPREREELVAHVLLERLGSLCGAGLPDDVRPFLRLFGGGTPLTPAARVRGPVRIGLASGAPISLKRLAATLRAAARSIGR
jgi:hypothetical protein